MHMHDINFDDYEFVPPEPAPPGETVRAFMLRQTGRDFPFLEDATWEYVREYPPMVHFLTRLMMLAPPKPIMLRKKQGNQATP